MTPEQAASATEGFACPTCGSPAGRPCRTAGGSTAFRYHTARFILVEELSGEPEVLVPDDREPGRTWQAPTASAPPEHPAGTLVRIGYACGTPASPELQGQLDALRAAGCGRIFREHASARVKDRPELAKALRLAASRSAPGGRPVTLTVHELGRLARTAAELMTLAAALAADGTRLELLTGPLAGTYDPRGAGSFLFDVLAAAAGLDRNHRREKSIEGQRAAAAQGRRGGRPRVFDDELTAAALAMREQGMGVPEIAARLVIPEGKNAGRHPSLASVYRALADADARGPVTTAQAGEREQPPHSLANDDTGPTMTDDDKGPTMTWAKQAAPTLAEALGGWLTADGVAAAAAAVDATETVVAASPPDLPADGRFEIGSVTKTMTATVLAVLAAEGALGLDDPIGRWLSAGPHGEITVRQLATHTSGLPAVAPNRASVQTDPANPWAGYTFDRAEEGLRRALVTPGNPWRYSNLGYQLLGLILQRASGTDYPALMTGRLLDPLSMAHSGTAQRGAGTLLPGHAGDRQAPRWEHPWGAGGIEATIADLARYARASLFPPDTPLGAAIRLAQTPLLPREDGSRQALAWVVDERNISWHTGGTGGFSSCVMVGHGRGRAVAALLSYGGSPAYASRLRQAAQLVLAGGDPRLAAEPEPWPSWRADAADAVRALLAGRVAQVHARLAPHRREKVSVPQLERAWAKAVPHAAPDADVAIVRHEVAASGAVVADVAITSADGSSRLRLVILPTGELGGFTPAPNT